MCLVRTTGAAPVTSVWKTDTLLLRYARMAEEGVHDTQSFRISTLSRRLPRPLGFLLRIGDHSRIQTCNLALRTGLLCPVELRGHSG